MDRLTDMGYRVFTTDLVSFKDYVRHDAVKLNQALIKLIEAHRVIRR